MIARLHAHGHQTFGDSVDFLEDLGDIIAPGLFLPALYPGMFWQHMDIELPRMIVKGIDDIRVFDLVTQIGQAPQVHAAMDVNDAVV